MKIKQVTIYQCDCCEHNRNCQYRSIKAAFNRERKCGYNIANKTCLTCANSLLLNYENRRFYLCKLNMLKYPIYRRDCSKWEYDAKFLFFPTPTNIAKYTMNKSFNNIVYKETDGNFDIYEADGEVVIYPKDLDEDFTDGVTYICFTVSDYLIIVDKE